MKKVFKSNIEAGQQKKKNDPRLIEEIVKDFLTNSNSPFAVAYRQQREAQERRQAQARQQATRTEGLKPNTVLCCTVKTLLHTDSSMRAGKNYVGTLRRDVECEEFRYDDQHFTFTESAPQTVHRNPQVFNGKYITITRWADGTFRPNLKPQRVGDNFDIIGYASSVSNELLWALESLIERNYTKGTVPNV